ncbi:hypothetical protein S7335_2116 [Synechococcus sp. PCC 7335]|uniref:hypothetical protein n=1 Tax=Synechococcus sp. (strain ATCC 29403 / PCC 7335) TaxID=91464 RepID=UPI00017EE05E|nr:hypothetical protein [Synechococcus sp. PCC 7335]EDX84419.1 hypothetical protein S7335_2116 [Synechococcus sp. PCC 7335]
MADINCAVDCKNGCVLGDDCPHKDSQQQASKFIEDTSLDTMLEMAAEAVRRKQQERAAEGPKWVFPEDGIQNS